jgi:exodeoxyribonuclease-1
MFPVESGCLCLAWPLAQHPSNKNEVIIWNLAHDPRELSAMNAETIRLRLFSKTDELPEGMQRLPVKTIHLNKSPIVIKNLKTLLPEMAKQWNLSLEVALQHAEYARALPNLDSIWQQVFQREVGEAVDVDQDLYNGFVSNTDRRILQNLSSYSAEKLASKTPQFEDKRLEELVFRYRARHFPTSLNAQETQRWEALRASRFFEGSANAITLDDYLAELDRLSETANQRDEEILSALADYAERIVPMR